MTRFAKMIAVTLLGGFLFVTPSHANTYTAQSCSQSAVAAAIANAHDGDTVVLPACSSTTPGGPNTWGTNTQGTDTPLVISVDITLIGQGIGNTVIIDNNFKGASNCAGSTPLIGWNVDSYAPTGGGPAVRLSGLTILGDAPDPSVCQPGHIKISGNNSAVRIDHVAFTNQKTVGVRMGGCIFGVGDHNAFQGVFKQGFLVEHDSCFGGANGDGDWATATQLGTRNFWFIENNTFTDPQAVGAGAMDGLGGMRVVFRYNTASFIAGHGTESGGRLRGMRAFEIYNNTFTAVQSPQFAAIYLRSGTGVVWGNDFKDGSGGTGYTGFVNIVNDRDTDAFNPWGACDGTGPYDNNAGTVFAHGTAGGGSTVGVLSDTTQNWTANAWVGSYSIRNVTQGWGSRIVSNTSNSITNAGSAFGQNRTWNVGDQYQVLSVYPCVDQVGQGVGIMLSNATPSPIAWVAEALEPVYQWSNTHNGAGTTTLGSQSTRIIAGRDYYDNVQKPNYTPYTYPHPLTQNGAGAPSPATNLAATGH